MIDNAEELNFTTICFGINNEDIYVNDTRTAVLLLPV